MLCSKAHEQDSMHHSHLNLGSGRCLRIFYHIGMTDSDTSGIFMTDKTCIFSRRLFVRDNLASLELYQIYFYIYSEIYTRIYSICHPSV